MVTSEELTAVSDRVGDIEGWDFSRVNVCEGPTPWEYEDVVRLYLKPDSRVADLGTGGGEVFSQFAPDLGAGFGFDMSLERLEVASRDQHDSSASNLAFALADSKALPFRDQSLDVVLASYADFLPAEVHRVLRSGGIFITQQMGDREMTNIFDIFGGVSFGDYWRQRFAAVGETYRSTRECARAFEAFGARVIRYDEYDHPQFFQDLDSLVLYLKASPLPEPFDPSQHTDAINLLQERYSTAEGIQTNVHRELLIIRRP